MCGTPPTAVSAGTVFAKYRKRVLTGAEEDAGWAEWSVPNLTDAHDPQNWYLTNPSLGTILTERKIRSELGDDQVDDNIQRLGLWLRYAQKSAISREEWEHCALASKPDIGNKPRIFFAVKYGKTGNVSLSAAVKLADGRVFVEAIDCRPIKEGNNWIIPFLRNPHAESVCIDGAGQNTVLVTDMKNASVRCKAVLPKVDEVTAANALFEQQLFAGNLCHMNQPALAQIASNCEHRAIGTGGGFGYSSVLEGADISLLESVSLAHFLAFNAKERKKQIISI
jgi:phage terminase large subunit-like protein